MTLAVTGGRVLRPDATVERADVLIDDGEIVAVEPGVDADEELPADDGLVIPGLVNGHTHLAMTLLRGRADDKPLDTWLREDVWPVEAAMTEADVRAGTRLGLAEAIKAGTTALVDMYFHVPTVAAVIADAGVRARLAHGIVTVGKDDEAARADIEEGIAVAADLDGAADGRIRTAVAPHSLTTVGSESLDEIVPEARELGVPIHFHANETADEVDPIVDEYGVHPLLYAADRGLLSPDDFLAHGVHLTESEIELLAETGTGVIHCPASNMKLASGVAPVQRLLEAGVTVGLGTDGPASNNGLDPLGEARDAALLGKIGADDARAVGAADAIAAATAGSADAAGLPGGRIEAGVAADLAVVDTTAPHLAPDTDPVSHLVYAAAGSDVRHTVCDGRVLMRDRELTTIDETAAIAAAEERAATLDDRT